jgi:hypothetical protein
MSVNVHGLRLKQQMEQEVIDLDTLPEWYRELPLENIDRLVEQNPLLYRREGQLGRAAREAADRKA